MRILITGGTGFIGSHLCQRLLNEGNYIICLDNNFTGKMENITSIKNHPNFEFIRHDITQPILLEVDQIYHLACPASPKAYQYNPIKTIKTNILGTLNALGIAKRVKATILLTSTSEIYGDPTINPQVEEYWGNVNPIGIRSCYDEGKRVAETLMMEYNRSNQTQIRIARIFNTYGPNMDKDDGRVVSNFINQAINQQDITIYGTGDQTRSFCYVDDTVEALIKLMNQNKTNGPINIGNPYEMTMNELAQKILTLMPYSSSKIIYEQLPNDDPRQRKPDISKAKEYLDWTPSTKLEDGLNKTIKYFLDIY